MDELVIPCIYARRASVKKSNCISNCRWTDHGSPILLNADILTYHFFEKLD
jgi:hypothetical protein